MSKELLKQAEARVGERAGGYTLARLIDVGGMAAVYEGVANGQRVAVKVLHRAHTRVADTTKRFAREAYVANSVGHEDVVQVIEDGVLDDDTPYLVMELLEGLTLQERFTLEPPVSLPDVLFVADRVLDVLAAAHAKHIVHRDVKPPNIYLTRALRVKVLDFGLARVLEGGESKLKTRYGTVIGSASYMSPEQASGDPKAVDHRADLWSLGAIMFRALAGRTVHNLEAAGTRALLAAATKRAPSLSKVADGLPPGVVAVVDRTLRYYKDDRWESARTMQAAIREAHGELLAHVDAVAESEVGDEFEMDMAEE